MGHGASIDITEWKLNDFLSELSIFNQLPVHSALHRKW
jgi:hypothetical protein